MNFCTLLFCWLNVFGLLCRDSVLELLMISKNKSHLVPIKLSVRYWYL